jgi:hypothetical protein
MYSSGIFLKNSIVSNRPIEQNYYEPYNLPLSPHKASFAKPPTILFNSNNNNNNINNINSHYTNNQTYKPIEIPIYNHH